LRTTDEIPRRLEDYALLGDTHTAALVHRDGSVDWLCLPRFDSPAVFAALLGSSENGRWELGSSQTVLNHERRYRGETMVLDTDITTPTGRARVTDFMVPRGGGHPSLVRIVVGLEGSVSMSTDIRFRFNYGEVAPWVRNRAGALVAVSGSDSLVLRTPVPLQGAGLSTVGRFDVAAGDRVPFVLTWSGSHERTPPPVDPDGALTQTERFWSAWSGRLTPDGPYRDAVVRSLLTLKALTYLPTGGIVAAPTTSLPERVGGGRNWDYRYTWLRDASVSLGALQHSGHVAEGAAFCSWMLRAAYGDPSKVQIMYGVGGERLLPETQLPWLGGFAGSAPVRVGNAAAGQAQLDVYGEVIMALEEARDGGYPPHADTWAFERALLSVVEQRWREPDRGIWEIRGAPRHFVHSKLLAWAAADRMVRAAERYELPAPVEDWRALRDSIRQDILERGYDPERNRFVQSYGSTNVDASLLQIPLVGLLPGDDPWVQGTISAIEDELLDDNGLVLRYRTDPTGAEALDGLAAGEGAFLPCSFWLADAYVMAGRIPDARLLFERLLGLGNDLGLFAEEYDSVRACQIGNFPQAFTHVAVVHSARLLSEGASASPTGRWLAPRSGLMTETGAGDTRKSTRRLSGH
jgi:GH15 family glucan-1,4-alpha-glucosidase